MKNSRFARLLLAAALGCAANALADDAPAVDSAGGLEAITIVLPPVTATLKPSPNLKFIRDVCTECHTVNYPTTQPRLDRAGWQGIITKMNEKFGMDKLSPEENNVILDYLVTNYGKP